MDKFLKRAFSSSDASECAKTKCRKYDQSYMQFGFTELANKPQCVVCSEVLSAESMKPSKMKRHLETKHFALKDKPVEFFQRKLLSLRSQQVNITDLSNVSKNARKASYEVALKIAKKGKPHTIAEELILPAAIDMVSNIISPQDAEKLKKLPLSNDTIARRISDMVGDVQSQLKKQIKVLFLQFNWMSQQMWPTVLNFCATSGMIVMILFMKTYCFVSPCPIIQQVKVFIRCSLKQLNLLKLIGRSAFQFVVMEQRPLRERRVA